MMIRGSFVLNDEGISPVLGSVLILAIGMTILATVQLDFIPVWNAQEELSHLGKMNDDFSALKSSIEESAISGTTLSSPLSMGFKYSPKFIVYNPRETAWATLSIQKDVWAEVRYNEVLPNGIMDDNTTIKNISTSTITYTLHGTQNLSYFIYEHGLIRRSTSNYTSSTPTLLSNGTLYLLSVNATDPETTNSVGSRMVNIYSTSQAKNSVIGKNVWLKLRTRYPDWWKDEIGKQGGSVDKVDNDSGIVIAHFDSMVIRMGETQVTTIPKKPPPHSPPARLVMVSPQNVNLPVTGISSLEVEVQDFYNNPFPNVQVNFNINSTRGPANAYSTANLSQNSAISGADGIASVQLTTNGPGLYYIDASLSNPAYTTTFAYPASSQSGFISLSYAEALPDYIITATLKDGFGQPMAGNTTSFSAGSNATVTLPPPTDQIGNTNTTLNTSGATGMTVKNILSSPTNTSAIITWDTVNTITVAVNRTPGGYIFNSIDIPAKINSTGCVNYGTVPNIYTKIACDSLNRSSHNVSLSLLSNTVYYFIVNSSYGGTNVNSTEYMFVTGGVTSTTPPASVTNLVASAIGPLYINWTWTDPTGTGFDHVQIYIDGAYVGNVQAGVQYFNATYFMPNSTHNITTYTADGSGNVNATGVYSSATTQSMFTYVFGFLNITGMVTNFNSAQSDSGAPALFNETLSGGRDNYTYVTSNTTTIGNITNWTNMQSATNGAYANLTEGAVNTSAKYKWMFNSTNESWVPSYTTTGGTVIMAFNSGDGNPAGSINSTLSGDNTNAYTATTVWTSPNFTWTNGTPASARLDFDWKVATYTSANAGSFNVTLVKPDSTVSQLYSNTFSATAAWSTLSNATLSTGDFSQQGNYSLKLYAVLKTKKASNAIVSVGWDNPTITLNYTTYRLNITTNTSTVPVDTNYYLEINYTNDTAGGYSVYVFNGTAWNNRGSLNSSTWAVFNYTLDNTEYNSGNVGVMYIDQTPNGTTQGNLSIDYQRIHGFTPTYDLNITTNTTNIPNATTQVLQIKYNVSGDNFTLQLWNGSAWNNKTTLSNTSLSYYNITLNTSELILNTTLNGNAGNLNTYDLTARYLDINATGGKLYLYYQRVNST